MALAFFFNGLYCLFIQLSSQVWAVKVGILICVLGLYAEESHIIYKFLVYIREYCVLSGRMSCSELKTGICFISSTCFSYSKTAGCILFQIVKSFFVYRIFHQILLSDIYFCYIGDTAFFDNRLLCAGSAAFLCGFCCLAAFIQIHFRENLGDNCS